MIIRFLLVCEGPSDAALVPHIRALLIHHGVVEADGTASYGGRTLADKIRLGLQLYEGINLLFVHRDADDYRDTPAAGPKTRYDEIAAGVRCAEYGGVHVPIVPVCMTEAWLLGDETAIRRVSGRPNGMEPLDLPLVSQLEEILDPKDVLRDALTRAGAPKGNRRRKNFHNDFGNFRRQLLENLPIGGPLEQLSSWARFRDDARAALLRVAPGL